MDTRTIIATLALLGSGSLLNGCKAVPEAGQTTHEVTPAAAVPRASSSMDAREPPPAGHPATTVPRAPRGTTAKEVMPDAEPAVAAPTRPRAGARRTTPANKPAAAVPPAPHNTEVKEVTPVSPPGTKGPDAADAKGEMKCGEGKCGAAGDKP